MEETVTLKKLDRAPDWLLDLFEEIDTKRFGPGFDCLADDAEMIFGVWHLEGREQIRSRLEEFDRGMATRHVILEFWDGGPMKLVRGEVTMRSEDGTVRVPALVHIIHMSVSEPDKIVALHAAAGPIES